ncbi:hypothetical protein QR680_018886 [Steinernema hermaphroditum]|uniref:Uncharacterized protein n=1 Tax=Steinernema hermaphroditum TaxID=289476 RepID=A0AA39HJB0_9BILA|nr:hypothetical protein QR680_018886 [Steinernema hermaphroditum]
MKCDAEEDNDSSWRLLQVLRGVRTLQDFQDTRPDQLVPTLQDFHLVLAIPVLLAVRVVQAIPSVPKVLEVQPLQEIREVL